MWVKIKFSLGYQNFLTNPKSGGLLSPKSALKSVHLTLGCTAAKQAYGMLHMHCQNGLAVVAARLGWFHVPHVHGKNKEATTTKKNYVSLWHT